MNQEISGDFDPGGNTWAAGYAAGIREKRAPEIRPSHYTVPEVAKLLQLHPRTVYDLCASGDIPCIRIGKAVRIPRVQFEARFSGANR